MYSVKFCGRRLANPGSATDLWYLFLVLLLGSVACECNQHSKSCVYNEIEGYGVCQHCLHNTVGDHCEGCRPLHYHNSSVDFRDPNACPGSCIYTISVVYIDGVCVMSLLQLVIAM